jgi:hypothetical protein
MFTQSFPPVNALIDTLKSVDYQKHLNTYLDIVEIVVMTIAAVSYVIYCNVKEWYQNGGKESIIKILQWSKKVLILSYTWVRSEGIPNLMILKEQINNLIAKIADTYKNWSDLVAV